MEVCVMRYTLAALCIAVLATSGSVMSEETPGDLSTYELTIDITNRIYRNALLKPDSEDYKTLSSQLHDVLNSVYGCATCDTHSVYHKASAVTFSNQTGTVLVKATLEFQSHQSTADAIKDMFMKAIAGSNEIKDLKFNPKFTQVTATLTPTTAASRTSHPTTASTKASTKTPVKPTKPKEHSNAASSFNQSSVALTSLLCCSVSFCLFFFFRYSL